MFEKMMRAALATMSTMAKLYSPADVQTTLLAYGAELDRLRAEVNELRSKLQEK